MENKMNQLLSDLVVEYHKLQNFHWYVKGPDFFQVHLKLEEMYNAINVAIDEVAEAMLMQGDKPYGNLKEFLSQTKIEEAQIGNVKSSVVWSEVLKDFKYLQDLCKDIKEEAGENKSSNIEQLMDGYISAFDKDIWMLNQVTA
ncbi:DNA starvation/stationary phase protection protein [Marinilabiliaceae bacterium JC040]|nr:DNA starvation/stationary phase protection protein [Marinilabiliaceae bacterium JC040]